MYCDEHSFRNYSGVEEHEVTATELQGHIDAGHLAEFDSYEELASYVGGKPILNKIGLIIKVRNDVSKARMILDTKETGVKRIMTKTQTVAPPKIFDAVLRMLGLLALCTTADADTISAFVLTPSR